MKKRLLTMGTSLLCLLLLCGLPRAWGAGTEIRTEKNIVQTGRSDRREFSLQYKVWQEEPLVPREPASVFLVVDNSALAAGEAEEMREALEGFFAGLARSAPETEVVLLRAGGRVEASRAVDAAESAEVLGEFLAEQEPQGRQNFGAALELAAELAELADSPVYLVTLACPGPAPSAGEALRMQAAVQRVRDGGGKSFTAVAAGVEETFQKCLEALASAPVEGRSNFYADGLEDCLEAVRKEAAGAYEVQVVEELDPRFTLSAQEVRRLEKTGAKARQKSGVWKVTWQVELPRWEASPWQAVLTVEARKNFPGGNGVPTSGEGCGVYGEGGLLEEFAPTKANVAPALDLAGQEAEIFLGETVPTCLDGAPIEEKMLGFAPEWFGKPMTGVLSFQWDSPAGIVGGVEQLGKAKPEGETEYRLRVAFTPQGDPDGAAGLPVERVEAEGWYKVRVAAGTLRVRVKMDGLTNTDKLPVLVRGGEKAFLVEALPEADPQSGGLTLEAEVAGLPYGKYVAEPLAALHGRGLAAQECLLGVCREDDTVDVARRYGVVKFTA